METDCSYRGEPLGGRPIAQLAIAVAAPGPETTVIEQGETARPGRRYLHSAGWEAGNGRRRRLHAPRKARTK